MIPIVHYFHDTRDAALAVTALRNEATACDALQRFEDAGRLRTIADQLQRSTFACRPISYRPSLAEVVIESSPSVRAVVADYQSGADRPQGQGA